MSESYIGTDLLDLIEEGLELRAKIKNTGWNGYRNPLWYDEARDRLSEIEAKISEVLKHSSNP